MNPVITVKNLLIVYLGIAVHHVKKNTTIQLMRDSNKIRSWAFANKIYISSHAVWNDEGRKPQDLQIVVNYWKFITRGKILYSQKKKDLHIIENKVKELYRHYYETYLENPKEVKI